MCSELRSLACGVVEIGALDLIYNFLRPPEGT